MMKNEITIRELHHNTGELVRAAGEAKTPVAVTDRGKIVAVIGSPKLVKTKKRKRGLPQSYLDFVKTLPRTDVMQYLDEERER
jgi:prevent-host-death family protein